jgi:hypothetical protein
MYCIIANVKEDKAFRNGAKVYLLNGRQSSNSVEVHGISKGGRKINKYIPYKRLENFRAAWVPDHLNYEKTKIWWGVGCWWELKEDAQDAANKLAMIWAGIRYFSENEGRLMQDGAPTSEAHNRARGERLASHYSCNCIPMEFMKVGHTTHQRFTPSELKLNNVQISSPSTSEPVSD